MLQLLEFKNTRDELLRCLYNPASPKTNNAVIFLHGFERTAVEMKFKNIVDALKNNINMYRLDFAGSALSDGDFAKSSLETMVDDLNSLMIVIKTQQPYITHFSFVSHSFGSIVALAYTSSKNLVQARHVLMAPALNQKELHRYWYAKNQAKAKKLDIEITWENFREYFNEEDFINSLDFATRPTKSHIIANTYFKQSATSDYQQLVKEFNPKNLLIVHGLNDESVPINSNNKISTDIELLSIKKGDHNLESVFMVNQYLPTIINFLVN